MPDLINQAISVLTGTGDQIPIQNGHPVSNAISGNSVSAGVDTHAGNSSASAGGNIQVKLFLRQAKSSDDNIVIQIRAYFFYASYSSTNYASLEVYQGTSTSGRHLLSEGWEWNRVISRNDEDRKFLSQWYTLATIPNTTNTINIYAVCRPSLSYPEVGYQLQLSGPKPCYWLNIARNDSSVNSFSYDIDDYSGVYGANRLNQTAQYALVYQGDKITWRATPKSGYKIDPKDAHIESPGGTQIPGASIITVRAYTYIRIIAKAMATLRMKIGGVWNMYSIYVRRGGAWVQHQAHIRSANKWDQYS